MPQPLSSTSDETSTTINNRVIRLLVAIMVGSNQRAWQ
jgi:hypothetical protein